MAEQPARAFSPFGPCPVFFGRFLRFFAGLPPFGFCFCFRFRFGFLAPCGAFFPFAAGGFVFAAQFPHFFFRLFAAFADVVAGEFVDLFGGRLGGGRGVFFTAAAAGQGATGGKRAKQGRDAAEAWGHGVYSAAAPLRLSRLAFA